MPLSPYTPRIHIAYFSMEIAVRSDMPTYSGGLGILAGDTARSCADLELHVVFVTLISRAGYFRQQIDANGRQTEQPDWWEPAKWCTPLDAMVAVQIEGRAVWIRPWLYVHTRPHGYQIPILLLDTDLEQNSEEDRTLTHYLYGGDEAYRMKQEIILGIGGIRLLRALDFDIHTYHLNEGHAAFLTLDLLNRYRIPPEELEEGESTYEVAEVRERCVFTTHTSVEAGHDQFSYDLFQRLLPDLVVLDELKRLAGRDRLNMTQLALNLAGYINGVARRHAETTEHMFPGYRVHAVNNGIHVQTWAHDAFARLYDTKFPQWCHEPEIFVRALQLSEDEIWRCHQAAKSDLIARVKEISGVPLDPEVPIVGFARRMTSYKRPMLLFTDPDRLAAIASRHPFQVVMAGKAHPQDLEGKEAIAQVHRTIQHLQG
jgi:starch phosphorylase